MAKQVLVIDGADQAKFFFSVAAGTLAVGGDAKQADLIFRNLHIARIRCEVEVDEERVLAERPPPAGGLLVTAAPRSQELRLGEVVQIGTSRLRLEAPAAGSTVETPATSLAEALPELAAPPPEPPPPAPVKASPAAAAPQVRLMRRFVVVDGADQGHIFPLVESGAIIIGKNHKHADIVLNDLYVSRSHCELHIEGDCVTVVHLSGQEGTLINGQRVTRQQLFPGDVLRVGNSHMRLETVAVDDRTDGAAAKRADDSGDAEDQQYAFAGEEGGFEIVEEEKDDATEPDEAKAAFEPVVLPHAPVDELLKLEGQTLAHYQIGPLLGRGQCGLVFRAQDMKSGQVVALKVLSPDFPRSEAELQCFVRALKMVPPLQHMHLVSLYGAGRTGPYCWMARQYIEGESLSRLITRRRSEGRFDWSRACPVALHLGRVLDFLHQHRVCHGNITPRNILIAHSDRMTKLADLMLAQALDGSLLQKAIRNNKLLIELPYRAPELADPQTPPTPQGDLYSLGTVLYALLTGQPPYSGASAKETLAQIRAGSFVRPSELQPGIPAPFEAAVLKMMASRRSERFQSAAAMLAVVEPMAKAYHVKV